ncbi:hypothetical protein GCM10009612_69680 [Streptomyces beijiangensis]
MAAWTRCLVSSLTPGKALATRETVCEETPATRATSAIDAFCVRRRPAAPPRAEALSSLAFIISLTRCRN